MTKTITDQGAAKLKAPKAGQQDHFESAYPGLVLRVSYRGRKTWCYVYRFDGKQRRVTLGSYPEMTVAEAHDAWREKRDQVRSKKDPAAKPTEAGRTDFKGVVAEWLKRDQAKNRSGRVVGQIVGREAIPCWGDREIGDIKRRDVLDLIDRIVDRGHTPHARRVHTILHRLFAWSVGRGIIELNPLANLPRPGTNMSRDRVLIQSGEKVVDPYRELIEVWQGADELGWPYGQAFQLLILTGARREEIAQLKWSELDDPANPSTITLSGNRTKNGKPHTIPLSAPARAILQSVPRMVGGDYVFTHSGISPISRWSHAKADLDDLVELDEPWVTHDLRRTVATGLQRLKIELRVTESILGHTAGSRSGVVGIYQRHDYADEKRVALEVWGAQVMALVDGRQSKVVAFAKK